MSFDFRARLNRGVVIPALPLALNAQRKLDERRQKALLRYYAAAGAGGVAVGVHATQFAIHNPKVGLYEPLLDLARVELDRGEARRASGLVRIAGICGATDQAVREASMARGKGFHAGLLNLSALGDSTEEALIGHAIAVADVLPLFGFYLQPAVGGRTLSQGFWRRFVEIPNLTAIKIAPFNRYQTIDVVRAVSESGRDDIALYTGNDDQIVLDLLTPFHFGSGVRAGPQYIVGGLLGHWSVWTRRAVEMHSEARRLTASGRPIPPGWLSLAAQVTEANAALFDVANGFAGCIPGLHEVLRRQGLLEGAWCLNPAETLSPGQSAEIDRVYRAYPQLNDDAFVNAHRDEWLNG